MAFVFLIHVLVFFIDHYCRWGEGVGGDLIIAYCPFFSPWGIYSPEKSKGKNPPGEGHNFSWRFFSPHGFKKTHVDFDFHC